MEFLLYVPTYIGEEMADVTSRYLTTDTETYIYMYRIYAYSLMFLLLKKKSNGIESILMQGNN